MPTNSPATTPEDRLVVDSWALLAWIRDEPAASRVNAILLDADAGKVRLYMSWINAGEVYYMLARKHSSQLASEFLARLPSLPLQLMLPNEKDIIAAARMKSIRKLSYADAFAAVLSQALGARLLTGDPELAFLTDVPAIEWIGPANR
jgi:predicted nucleic acid-binding protein